MTVVVTLVEQANMVEVIVQAVGWDTAAEGVVAVEGVVREDVQWDAQIIPKLKFSTSWSHCDIISPFQVQNGISWHNAMWHIIQAKGIVGTS